MSQPPVLTMPRYYRQAITKQKGNKNIARQQGKTAKHKEKRKKKETFLAI
jgi:hypothetical protein